MSTNKSTVRSEYCTAGYCVCVCVCLCLWQQSCTGCILGDGGYVGDVGGSRADDGVHYAHRCTHVTRAQTHCTSVTHTSTHKHTLSARHTAYCPFFGGNVDPFIYFPPYLFAHSSGSVVLVLELKVQNKHDLSDITKRKETSRLCSIISISCF